MIRTFQVLTLVNRLALLGLVNINNPIIQNICMPIDANHPPTPHTKYEIAVIH